MTMFKCKICGGTLQSNNESVAVCECYGTRQVLSKLEEDRLEGLYNCAKKAMSEVNTESGFREASYIFKTISDYKDAATLAQVCCEKAEIARKNAILADGKYKMTKGEISDYKLAIKLFEFIPGWKDADEQVVACKKKIKKLKAKDNSERINRKSMMRIVILCAVFGALLVCSLFALIILW